jgi:hypothetical protein
VSCGFNPSTSLHTVHNLCLRSSVKSWIEMEAPFRTACTNESQCRNPWKSSKTWTVQVLILQYVCHQGQNYDKRGCQITSLQSTRLDTSTNMIQARQGQVSLEQRQGTVFLPLPLSPSLSLSLSSFSLLLLYIGFTSTHWQVYKLSRQSKRATARLRMETV